MWTYDIIIRTIVHGKRKEDDTWWKGKRCSRIAPLMQIFPKLTSDGKWLKGDKTAGRGGGGGGGRERRIESRRGDLREKHKNTWTQVFKETNFIKNIWSVFIFIHPFKEKVKKIEMKRRLVAVGKVCESRYFLLCTWSLTKRFSVVVKTHKRKSKKIYKTKLTNVKIENQVMSKYRVDPKRAGLTLIAELTWSNLGLKEV